MCFGMKRELHFQNDAPRTPTRRGTVRRSPETFVRLMEGDIRAAVSVRCFSMIMDCGEVSTTEGIRACLQLVYSSLSMTSLWNIVTCLHGFQRLETFLWNELYTVSVVWIIYIFFFNLLFKIILIFHYNILYIIYIIKIKYSENWFSHCIHSQKKDLVTYLLFIFSLWEIFHSFTKTILKRNFEKKNSFG